MQHAHPWASPRSVLCVQVVATVPCRALSTPPQTRANPPPFLPSLRDGGPPVTVTSGNPPLADPSPASCTPHLARLPSCTPPRHSHRRTVITNTPRDPCRLHPAPTPNTPLHVRTSPHLARHVLVFLLQLPPDAQLRQGLGHVACGVVVLMRDGRRLGRTRRRSPAAPRADSERARRRLAAQAPAQPVARRVVVDGARAGAAARARAAAPRRPLDRQR